VLVKALLVFEIAHTCAQVSGRARQQVVREQLGELAGIVKTFRCLVVAAEAGARPDGRGHVIPDRVPLATAGMLNATLYPRAIELLQLIGTDRRNSLAQESAR
jgi:4-hydroxyphenylacetate 3-monooxygenase/anthranilate 3-monooxygenase (FAD)/4-hydroxyphenylacetate 3-monooxygenase